MQPSLNGDLVPEASLFHFVLLWLGVCIKGLGTVVSLLEGYLGHVICQLL